jgi:hypothetical protein
MGYEEFAICEDPEEQVSHLMQVCEEQRRELDKGRTAKADLERQLDEVIAEGEKVHRAFEKKVDDHCKLETKLAYVEARCEELTASLKANEDIAELERTYNDVLRSNQTVLDDIRRAGREREAMVREDWRSATAFHLSSSRTDDAGATGMEIEMMRAVGDAKDKVIEAKDERIADLLRQLAERVNPPDRLSVDVSDRRSPTVVDRPSVYRPPSRTSLSYNPPSVERHHRSPAACDDDKDRSVTPLRTRNSPSTRLTERRSYGAENSAPGRNCTPSSESRLRMPGWPTPKSERAPAKVLERTPSSTKLPQRVRIR